MAIFTLIGIVVGIIIFFNFYYGFTLVVAIRLLVPPIVRFQLGPLDISLNTLLVFLLFIAFLMRREYKEVSYPKQITKYMFFFMLGSLFIIPFALIVPYNIQISSNIQFFITELVLGFMAWFAIKDIKQFKQFCVVILCLTIIISVYGIFTYIWKANPYVDILTFFYEPTNFVSYVEEDRGVLDGRISATTAHPLAWGQLLGLLLCFFVLIRKNLIFKLTFFKKIGYVLFYFLCISLFLVNMFLTGSRTVIAALGIFLCFLFLTFSIKQKLVSLFVIFVGLVLLAVVPTKQSSGLNAFKANIFFWDSKLADRAGIKGSSTSLRQDQLKAASTLLDGGYHFFGLGKGLVSIRDDMNLRIKNIEDLYGFESIILYKLVEQGIVGLFLFLLFYFQFYGYIRKKNVSYFNNKSKFLVDGFFLSYFVSIVLTGIQTTFVFFFLLGMTYLRYLELNNGINQKKNL